MRASRAERRAAVRAAVAAVAASGPYWNWRHWRERAESLAARFNCSVASITRDARLLSVDATIADIPPPPPPPPPARRMPDVIPVLPVRLASGWHQTTHAADRRAVLRRWLAEGCETFDHKALAAAWRVSRQMISVDLKAARSAHAERERRAAWAESVAASCAGLAPSMSDDAIESMFGIELDRAAA